MTFESWLYSLTISLKYPPLPKLFETVFDGFFDLLDHVGNGLSRIPPIVTAEIIMDAFEVPGKLRQRVMTLDQALLLPAKIIILQGIRSPITQLPDKWLFARLIMNLRKIGDFIQVPSFLRGFKALAGSIWTRLLSLGLIAVNVIRLFGLVWTLWNYVQLVQDESKWDSWLSGVLSQKNPRVKIRARINRRVGGVPP